MDLDTDPVPLAYNLLMTIGQFSCNLDVEMQRLRSSRLKAFKRTDRREAAVRLGHPDADAISRGQVTYRQHRGKLYIRSQNHLG